MFQWSKKLTTMFLVLTLFLSMILSSTAFASGDTTPPVVVSTDPIDKATNIPVNKVIKVGLNENIQTGSNYDKITLTKTPANWTGNINYNFTEFDGSLTTKTKQWVLNNGEWKTGSRPIQYTYENSTWQPNTNSPGLPANPGGNYWSDRGYSTWGNAFMGTNYTTYENEMYIFKDKHIYKYNPSNNTYTQFSTVAAPFDKVEGIAGDDVKKRFYIIGPFVDSNNIHPIYYYDVNTQKWEYFGKFYINQYRNGQVANPYLTVGEDGTVYFAIRHYYYEREYFWKINPDTKVWTLWGTSPQINNDGGFKYLPGGIIYYWSSYSSPPWQYYLKVSDATATLYNASTPPIKSDGHGFNISMAVTNDGRVFGMVQGSVAQYNPVNDTWGPILIKTFHSLSPRSWAMAGGKLYAQDSNWYNVYEYTPPTAPGYHDPDGLGPYGKWYWSGSSWTKGTYYKEFTYNTGTWQPAAPPQEAQPWFPVPPGTPVQTKLEIENNQLSIIPLADLEYGTTYTVRIPAGAVKDAAGNALANDSLFTFTTVEKPTDLTAPKVTASPPGGVYNSTQTVKLDADELASIYYTTDGSEPTVNSIIYNGPITIDTDTALKFIAVDLAGNQSPIYTENYTIDTVAPTVKIISPASGFINDNTPLLNYVVSDGIVVVRVDRMEVNKKPGVSLDSLADGPHTLKVEARDAAGNIGFDEVNFNIDTISPTTTVTLEGTQGNNGWFVSDVTATMTVADNPEGSGVERTEYSFDGQSWTTYTGPFTISAEGLITLYYRSIDKAGNTASDTVTNINIDKTQPEISINFPANGAEYVLGQTVLADWAASDALSGLDRVDATTPAGEAIDTSTVGEKTFTVTAVDKAGNLLTRTVTYHVVYAFELQIKDSKPSKAGSVLPVKFQAKDATGSSVTNAVARLYAGKVIDGAVGPEQDAIFAGKANTGNFFRYDTAEDKYIFNLATKDLSAGLWQLKIILDDGTSKTINIELK